MPLLVAAFGAAALAWATVTTVTLVGRVAYERRRRARRAPKALKPGSLRERRLLRRASRHRGEDAKWRRIDALRTLTRLGHPQGRVLLRAALRDADRDVAGAAVRLLGDLDAPWATRELIGALRHDRYQRSRIAAQLERRTPAIGRKLEPLLRSRDAGLRFWAATLLADCPGVAGGELLRRTRDRDPNVRAAAVETLADRSEQEALPAARELLRDDAWFVRVHACRAVGRLGTLEDAPLLARMLGDPKWWIRAAAKDALRGFGVGVAGALIPLLEHIDPFVRNGAAEVLQDVGLVDWMATTGREGELLERILQAGGQSLRDAARARAGRPRGDVPEEATA